MSQLRKIAHRLSYAHYLFMNGAGGWPYTKNCKRRFRQDGKKMRTRAERRRSRLLCR